MRLIIILLVLASPAYAQNDGSLAIILGATDLRSADSESEFGLEWALPGTEVWDTTYDFAIYFNFLAGAWLQDDSRYGYVGVKLTFVTDIDIWFSVSAAVGYYDRVHVDAVDLGGPFEFREDVRLSWMLFDDVLMGIGIYHLSNAGIYSANNGNETVYLDFELIF